MRLIITNKAEEDSDHEQEECDEAKSYNLNEIHDSKEKFYESKVWEDIYDNYESTDKYKSRAD